MMQMEPGTADNVLARSAGNGCYYQVFSHSHFEHWADISRFYFALRGHRGTVLVSCEEARSTCLLVQGMTCKKNV